MEWNKLLSAKRLGSPHRGEKINERSAFQVDFDRIVFSSDFRLLQDKTQVFPLPESDYVRNRLTHSLECSCVGRSLGAMIGKEIVARHQLKDIHSSDFGATVAAACLAHDIGNPPFGHSGEDCIRYWFNNSEFKDDHNLSEAERTDLAFYEGNAQGFRILANVHNPERSGGMQLTVTTLATFMKYPQESTYMKQPKKEREFKKFGFFQAEKELFREVAEELELKVLADFQWARHPLTYIVEAADDICYCVIDFEDGFNSGLISYNEIVDYFVALIESGGKTIDIDRINSSTNSKNNRIEMLRAMAINAQINQCYDVFLDNESAILEGNYKSSLTDDIPAASIRNDIINESVEKIYREQSILEIEAAGFEVFPNLLNYFINAVMKDDLHSKKINQLLPIEIQKRLKAMDSIYQTILSIIDFTSAMTDSSAVALYRKIKGISLPSQAYNKGL